MLPVALSWLVGCLEPELEARLPAQVQERQRVQRLVQVLRDKVDMHKDRVARADSLEVEWRRDRDTADNLEGEWRRQDMVGSLEVESENQDMADKQVLKQCQAPGHLPEPVEFAQPVISESLPVPRQSVADMQ
jgi:hypothetical protein